MFDGQRDGMRVRQQQQALAGATQLREKITRPGQPGHVRTHFAMQRTDVDAEIAAPVLDAIPGQRAAQRIEAPRDLGIGGVHVQPLRNREALRHEIAPDVVVIGLVEQRAIEVQAHGIDG